MKSFAFSIFILDSLSVRYHLMGINIFRCSLLACSTNNGKSFIVFETIFFLCVVLFMNNAVEYAFFSRISFKH